jgi:hypothetical protein
VITFEKLKTLPKLFLLAYQEIKDPARVRSMVNVIAEQDYGPLRRPETFDHRCELVALPMDVTHARNLEH